eukprot:1178533-Prorocentrum_minimum.AAC.1
MVRATCSYVPSVKEFGFQRKERREIGFQVGLRPPSSTRRSAKSKGDLNSNSGTKKRREKREISDPELVGPNDPKKFNSGWLNPERNQTRAGRLLEAGKGVGNKRGRPKKTTKGANTNHGGLPSQSELLQALGREDYEIVIGKYVARYCAYTRELQWWREGFVARRGTVTVRIPCVREMWT